jgi:hypothetical protein
LECLTTDDRIHLSNQFYFLQSLWKQKGQKQQKTQKAFAFLASQRSTPYRFVVNKVFRRIGIEQAL